MYRRVARVRPPGTGFLPGFATLLDRPQIVGGFINWLGGRRYLKGEFRGRRVVILLQRKRGRYDPPGHLVLSMETGAAATMESHDFANWPDRGTEPALFALEVKHELRLTHRDPPPEGVVAADQVLHSSGPLRAAEVAERARGDARAGRLDRAHFQSVQPSIDLESLPA